MKNVLQEAGLVMKIRSRRKHRKRRQRKPPPGMMLHIDGSHHHWFQDVRWADLFLQIEPTRLRSTISDLNVIVYEHLDGTLTIGYGPYTVGYYTPDGQPMARAPTRPSTREEPRFPFRPKRSALRAALGSTPADAPLSSSRKQKTENGNNSVYRVKGGR